jgi:hypothetical protein
MGLYEEIRQNAKMDSRRFAKSVRCSIIYGKDLDLLKAYSVYPLYDFFFDTKTGLDPIKNTLLAVQLSKREEFDDVLSRLNLTTSPNESESEDKTEDEVAALDLDKRVKTQEAVNGLKAMIILVSVDQASLGPNKNGKEPKDYDIGIESIDVSQSAMGTYLERPRIIERGKDLDK